MDTSTRSCAIALRHRAVSCDSTAFLFLTKRTSGLYLINLAEIAVVTNDRYPLRTAIEVDDLRAERST